MLAAVQPVGVTTVFSSVKTKSDFKDLKRKSSEAACYVRNDLFFNRKQVPFYLKATKEQDLLICLEA